MFDDETFSERSLNLCRRWIERNMKKAPEVQHNILTKEYRELVERNFGIFGIKEEVFEQAAKELGYEVVRNADGVWINMVEK